MRLRQAHALLDIAQILTLTPFEGSAYGWSFYPFDRDGAGVYDPPDDDYLTGFAEFNDPDTPEMFTRFYNVDAVPGPDDGHIMVRLTAGFVHRKAVFTETVDVSAVDPDEVEFRPGPGMHIARRIAELVAELEAPYQEASRKRRAETGRDLAEIGRCPRCGVPHIADTPCRHCATH